VQQIRSIDAEGDGIDCEVEVLGGHGHGGGTARRGVDAAHFSFKHHHIKWSCRKTPGNTQLIHISVSIVFVY
jgi:hypothetical protein